MKTLHGEKELFWTEPWVRLTQHPGSCHPANDRGRESDLVQSQVWDIQKA